MIKQDAELAALRSCRLRDILCDDCHKEYISHHDSRRLDSSLSKDVEQTNLRYSFVA